MTKKRQWTTDDDAWLLNWSDYCLVKNLDYTKTIYKSLSKRAGITLHNTEVRYHIYCLLEQYGVVATDVGHYTKALKLFHTDGTRHLKLSSIPEELKTIMNRQREELRIGTLEEVNEYVPKPKHLPLQVDSPLLRATRTSSGDVRRASSGSSRKHSLAVPDTGRKAPRLSLQSKELPSAVEAQFLQNNVLQDRDTSSADVFRPVSYSRAHPVQSTTPSTSRSQSTPNMVVQTPAGVTNSNDIVPMNLLPDHDDELELRGTLNWLMRLVVEPQEGSDLPDYMADRLTCIRRSIFASPTTAMPKLAQDLIAMEETLAKKTRTLNAMVGNTDWHEDLAVPPAPTVEKLASRWRDLRESVQDAVGLTRDDDLPQGHLALFLAGRSEEIMASNTSEVNLPSWIRDLKLGSAVQHAAHMIMGVILFVLVFSPTAAMHDAEAWKVADHIFGVIGEVDGGIATVQKLRKIGTKLRYQSQDYRETVLKPQVTVLYDKWVACLQALEPGLVLPSNKKQSRKWLQGVVELKQEMIVSPQEYRIRYSQPGTLFDATWMTAESTHGKTIRNMHANNKEILMCVFPALMQHSASSSTDAASANGKRFFSASDDNYDYEDQDPSVVAKAIVLLEDED